MPGPFPSLPRSLRGHVETLHAPGPSLEGNPWGDPSERAVHVYHPPAPARSKGPLPAILLLPGFAGRPDGELSPSLGQPGLAQRIDELIDQGCPPFYAVLPDAMTSLGGSQFLDSPAIGAYLTWLTDDILPWCEATLPLTGRWGAAGRSSGGLGSFNLALRVPDRVRAIAMHAADTGFDLAYLGDLSPAIRGIAQAGGLDRLLPTFWKDPRPSPDLFAAMNVACMACAYTPQPDLKPLPGRLPFDPDTGEIHFDVFQQWRRHDPVTRAQDPHHAAILRDLDLCFLDAGRRDEYNLHLGTRRLAQALTEQDVPHLHEEFDGGHRGTSYRYNRSLPLLARALHSV